jgi:hypothetical protein
VIAVMDKTIATVVPVLAVTEAASKLLIILSVKVPTGSESTMVCVALAMYENTGELSMMTFSLGGMVYCVISLNSALSYNDALTGLLGV